MLRIRHVLLLIVFGLFLAEVHQGFVDEAAAGYPPPITNQDAQRELNEAMKEYYLAQTAKLKDEPSFLVEILQYLSPFAYLLVGAIIGFGVDRLKLRAQRSDLHKRQKNAVLVAFVELRSALDYLLTEWGSQKERPKFLDYGLIHVQPDMPASADTNDIYVLKYHLVDTVYVLCAALGWIELYRQDLLFLRHDSRSDRKIQACFEEIKKILMVSPSEDLEVGKLNAVIMRDEQRAIGEKMLVQMNGQTTVMGYATFGEKLFRLPEKQEPLHQRSHDPNRDQDYWILIMTRFLTQDKISDRSRHERVTELQSRIHPLIELLTP